MVEFNWKYASVALVGVLAASLVAPYAFAQQASSSTIGSNSLFVSDQTSVKLVNVQTGVTSNFATDNINGPKGIIFTGGVSPVILVANQFPGTNLPGDIAKYDPSNGHFL